ncbi:hypothetical protein ACFY2M_02410 [Streptomyces sp. NPDC001276]|uniref:hypothetical protein n=1 Tax=Streptomyces sp. NPDC001276 TaxID=3364555 RepID=UPI0036786C83
MSIAQVEAISAVLAPWRQPRTDHDPGRIPLGLAPAVALGGNCLAGIALLRAGRPARTGRHRPDGFQPDRHDLATAGEKALTAIRAALAETRSKVRKLAAGSALSPADAVRGWVQSSSR